MRPERPLFLYAAALFAIAAPALLAYNVAPSSTFLNQALALFGWGGFVMALAPWVRVGARWSVVHSALALMALAALASVAFFGLPWPLALSSIGMLLAAAVALSAGDAAQRAGVGELAFSAFAWGLLLTGVLSTGLALVQYFLPQWPDGVWLAANATPGRSAGNLRQPNHLSSLLLWSVVALVGLADRKAWPAPRVAAVMALLVLGVALTASRTGMVGWLLLAVWGALDRRLSLPLRRLLMASPVFFALCWWGLGEWALVAAPGLCGRRPVAQVRPVELAFWHLGQCVVAGARATVDGGGLGRVQFRLEPDTFPRPAGGLF